VFRAAARQHLGKDATANKFELRSVAKEISLAHGEFIQQLVQQRRVMIEIGE
jgi:hypothetical protein